MVPVIEVRILVGERFAGGIGIRAALRMRYPPGIWVRLPGEALRSERIMNSSLIVYIAGG